MAAPPNVEAVIVTSTSQDLCVRSIEMVTEPRFIAPTAPSVPALKKAEDFYGDDAKEFLRAEAWFRTHVLFFNWFYEKLEVRAQPRTQPKRPEHWTEEAWNKRIVVGDIDYHMFVALEKEKPKSKLDPNSGDKSFPQNAPFILKVSIDKDSNGPWFYATEFNPNSESDRYYLDLFIQKLSFDGNWLSNFIVSRTRVGLVDKMGWALSRLSSMIHSRSHRT